MRGGVYSFGTLAGYELAHIKMGGQTGATPDGRFCGEPFAATITAVNGKDKNGVTAYLKSAASIDFSGLPSTVVVNLQLEPSLTENKKKLTAMIDAYFELGGIQLQINFVSAEQLLAAQHNPDNYCNLRVRVTGFSGFFTAFDKALQDEIISRKQRSSL